MAKPLTVRVSLIAGSMLALCIACTRAPVSDNLAPSMRATQSSTYAANTGAVNAVDGNTDGNYSDNSISCTKLDANAWWQVDLGAPEAVSAIRIWNRTDCCGDRLSDYWVFLSETPLYPTDRPSTLQNKRGVWSSHQSAPPGPSTTIPVDATGRYVRVQLTGSNYLALAEVQVIRK